jgi:hypothetical protein
LSTGAVTINVNGLGAKTIKKSNGNALASGNLKAGIPYTLRYNGTDFILQGEGGEYGNATAGQVLSPNTFGTDSGIVAGTMPNNGGLSITPGATAKTIPTGYTSGGTVVGDANLVAANIASGVSIFGIAGAAGNTKSIQRGSADIANLALMNIAISSINPAKSIVIIHLSGTSVGDIRWNCIKASIVDATTIRLERGVAESTSLIIHWQVIEFGNVKSKQTGDLAITAWEHDVAVTAVDMAKSIIVCSFLATGAGTGANHMIGSSFIKNSTTVTLSAYPSIGATMHWQLIDLI